jgi:hypothetical protein
MGDGMPARWGPELTRRGENIAGVIFIGDSNGILILEILFAQYLCV